MPKLQRNSGEKGVSKRDPNHNEDLSGPSSIRSPVKNSDAFEAATRQPSPSYLQNKENEKRLFNWIPKSMDLPVNSRIDNDLSTLGGKIFYPLDIARMEDIRPVKNYFERLRISEMSFDVRQMNRIQMKFLSEVPGVQELSSGKHGLSKKEFETKTGLKIDSKWVKELVNRNLLDVKKRVISNDCEEFCNVYFPKLVASIGTSVINPFHTY